MKNNLLFIALTFSAIFFISCEDVIEIELEQGPVYLVVDGGISDKPGINHLITLSTTAPYFENGKAPRVSGAFVEVTDYDQSNALVSIDTLKELVSGSGDYYTSITNGVVGHKYVLRVTALGQSYSAESIINRVPPIDSIKFEYREAIGPNKAGYSVLYFGPEPLGVGDYYLFKVSRNGKVYNKTNNLYFTSDELVDGNYIGNFDITPEPFELGDTISIEDFTLSKDHYKFYLELSQQVNNAGLFANPPANLRTNVKNINPSSPNAVGYFGAFGYSSITRIIQ